MEERIDLKEIERNVYTSYHQDGLFDITIGIFILGFGLLIASDLGWMGGIIAILSVSFYAAAKRGLTVPRIGFVKFAAARVKVLLGIAVAGLLLFMLLGIVAFFQFESGGTPPWLLFTIENSLMVVGASFAVLFCAAGYAFRVRRSYAYALLTLIVFVVGYYLPYPLNYYLILLGTLLLLFGLALLIRFMRRNPLIRSGSMGGSVNEE